MTWIGFFNRKSRLFGTYIMNKRNFEDFFRNHGFDLSRVHHMGVHNSHTNLQERLVDVKRIRPNQNNAVIWRSQSYMYRRARTELANPGIGTGFRLHKPYLEGRMTIDFSEIVELNELSRHAIVIHLTDGSTIQLYLEKTYHYL